MRSSSRRSARSPATSSNSVTRFAALLVGQPTLRTRLRLGVLAALDQRIALRAHIDGMTRDETASYISHHLALAGLRQRRPDGSPTTRSP